MTNAAGDTTAYGYDKLGLQVWVLDARGYLNESKYNDKGEIVETGSSDGTVYRYNATTDRLEVVQAGDPTRRQTMTMTYDEAGRKITETDALGRTTKFVYDRAGRLIETLHPDLTPDDWSDNPTTKTEYYSDGLVKAQVDERGNRTEYRYDEVGRQIAIITADKTPDDLSDNPTTRYSYDKAGQQTAMVDALGQVTAYQYDDLGRMVKTVYADQTFTTQAYDKLGRREAMTDQNGNRTEYRYDELGRLTGVKDALAQWTEYGYNEQGQLIWQEDANDHRTRYEYDKLGRRVAIVLPLGQQSTTSYDAVGNVKSVTDFNGKTTVYHYDEQNRLVLKDFEVDPDVRYSYTRTNQIATVTDGRGITTYTYNERDWLIGRTDPTGAYTPDGYSIEYQYDAAGNRTSVEIPSGTTHYTFNERNWLETVTDPNNGTTRYTYDAIGNLIRTEFPNGVTEIRRYTDLNRLEYLETSKLDEQSNKDILTSYTYTLDKVGNRLSVTDHTGRITEYDYDDIYRLEQEQVSQNRSLTRTTNFVYDKVGNRLSQTETTATGTETTTYQYDHNDRLEWEKFNGVLKTSYQYDDNGNTIEKTEAGVGTTTYTWNQDGRMVEATTASGKQLGYTYDSEGIRTSSTVDGVTTTYLLDKNLPYAQVLEEYLEGELTVSYLYGRDLISQERSGQTSFYLVDGLGSTAALTNEQGEITDNYTYQAFGEIENQAGETQNSYRFSGEQYDAELGDYYLRDRYYDQESGRFTRRDTYEGRQGEPLTLHKYGYTHNNPINGVDPSGLFNLSALAQSRVVQSILAAITYYTATPYLTDRFTLGSASTEEPPTNDKVVVDVYSWMGAPWGHASINIDGIVYNQGGAEAEYQGSSGMLWGEGWFIKEAGTAWYNRLSTDDIPQRLQRYSLKLSSAEKQRAKNYLDQEFSQASTQGSPDPNTTRLRGYHALWGNCTTTTNLALPLWASAAVPIVGYASPHHLAASLNILSQLPGGGTTRLVDKRL